MSPPSTAVERFVRWVDAEDDDDGVARFRRVFAAMWLFYDVVDLAFGLTERSFDVFPHARDHGLVAVQVVLVATGAMLVWGRWVWWFGLAAAVARATEGFVFFRLNDFFLSSVFLLLIAHSTGGPFHGERGGQRRRPRWVRDALLVELAFVYFATAILKMNPDWLGGGHLFVRTQYLLLGRGWPYPAWLEPWLATLAFESVLAKVAVACELALGVVLLVRRPYWLAAALVVGIHAFGTFMTNVWFLSATMIAGVLLLMPRPKGKVA